MVTARLGLIFAFICLAIASGAGAVVADAGQSAHEVNLLTSHDRQSATQVASDSHSPARASLHDLRQTGAIPPSTLQAIPETDATVTRIQVFDNGTAEWGLTVRMQLDSDDAETEFEAFRAEFEANRSVYLGDFQTRMEGVVSDASSVIGREMTTTGFEADIGIEEVPRRWGYVTYRFHWGGFASDGDGNISVGDVFEGGLFLEERDILVVRGPEGYDLETVEPEPDQTDEAELRWEGPTSFDDQRPSVTFAASDNASEDDTGTPDGSPPDDSGSGDSMPLGPVLAGAAGVTVLAGAGALYARRRRQGQQPAGRLTANGGPPGDSADGDPSSSDESPASGNGTPELVTDEDRVIDALETADGRLRQSELANNLDWSASKTSRVLSDMADDDQIEKLRIGRENVIDLVEDE